MIKYMAINGKQKELKMNFLSKVLLSILLFLLMMLGAVTNKPADTKKEDFSSAAEFALGEENYNTEKTVVLAEKDGFGNLDALSLTENLNSVFDILHTEGGFAVVSDGANSAVFSDFKEVLNFLPENSTLKFCEISLCGNINLEKNFIITGQITLSYGTLSVNSFAEFDAVDLNLNNSSVKIKEGSLIIGGGSLIRGVGKTPLVMDYSSSASLKIEEGEIYSSGDYPAIYLSKGRASVVGGKISSQNSFAIENLGTLSLAGNPVISGSHYSVNTDNPIRLSAEGEMFLGEVSVIYQDTFKKGSFTPVFYSAKEALTENISLFDKWGEPCETKFFASSERVDEENFLAVSNPFTARFYIGGDLAHREEFYFGERLASAPPPERLGFRFLGWYCDEMGEEQFSFGSSPDTDLILFGKYALLPPEFSISSLSFDYNGEQNNLRFDRVSHPLLEYGEFSYDWYKNGAPTGVSSSEFPLHSVSDSGVYTCILTFAYGGEFIRVETSPVIVEISKQIINAPTLAAKEYAAYRQTADIEKSHLFTALNEGGTEVGKYPVVLTLVDSINYKWSGTEDVALTLFFEISKAENFFISPPTVKNSFIGYSPKVSAVSYFGTARHLFSLSSEGPYSEDYPTTPGVYYYVAQVPECDNFYALRSEPIAFLVEEEAVVGIKIETPPQKTSYLAFEKFSLAGLSLLATYNSGRCAAISAEDISVEYPSGEWLLAGDSSVLIRYGDFSVPQAVAVQRIAYDLEPLLFSDKSVIYSGERQTLTPVGEVVGKDGIPLYYKVIGGGREVGVYEITLEFISSSPNYQPPSALSAALTVLPKEIKTEFENLVFVYDKGLKIPTAKAYDEELKKEISLTLSGGGIDAGIYTVTAYSSDKNYKLVSNTAEFEIKKADIDLSGVKWSGESFTYVGEPIYMTLTNLPEGVSVIGYTNGAFVEAGEYSTIPKLLFDEKNYNQPPQIIHKWSITPADYDLSQLVFTETVAVYDGGYHYPAVTGFAPSGKDGSTLTFEFSRGVSEVAEGRVKVRITFFGASKNYNTPEPIYSFVTVTPKPVEIEWGNLSFVYNGSKIAPTAFSEQFSVSISGFGVNAGEYIAEATSDNSNFSITNNKINFTIEKCPNKWLIPPSVLSIYYGKKLTPSAASLYGTPSFSYYSDEDLTERVELPFAQGKYYMVAEVLASQNYGGLRSEPIAFEIIPIIAEKLKVDFGNYKVRAYEKITEGKITVYAENNDGSVTRVDFSSLEISYQSGEYPLFRDTWIEVCALGVKEKISVRVEKGIYNTESVVWKSTVHTYDGQEKSSYLEGLPEGVSVSSYAFSSATGAGVYKLSAVLAYDSENFNEPIIPDGWLIINKAEVPVPDLPKVTYNGKIQSPDFEENPLYTAEVTGGVGVGEYSVIFRLKDNANYTFTSSHGELQEDGTLLSSFSVLPRKITLKVLPDGKSYEVIKGSVIEGDEIGAEFYSEDGFIYLKIENPNYEITVIPLKSGGALKAAKILFFVFLSVFLFALLVFALFIRREKLRVYLIAAGERVRNLGKTPPEKIFSPTEKILATDEAHAASLISDEGAKSLIRRGKRIYTDGYVRVIVNIDAISEAFEAGDAVDINSMKDRGLIPRNALSVKVLARGVIDKPLTVKANAFSLGAVKMIALTGGLAVVTPTSKTKK